MHWSAQETAKRKHPEQIMNSHTRRVERIGLMAWITISLLALSMQPAKATLQLHYTFDEASGDALDTSGVAPTANGTFTANAARTALGSTPSGTGYALDLTGNGALNNWVGVTAANGGSKLDMMQKFTLTIWVNMRSAPANTDRLLGRLSTTPFPGFDFMVGTPNSGALGAGNFKLAMAVDTSSALGSTADTGANGTWRFVALTYDGSLTAQNVRFYTGSTNEAVTQLGNAVTRNAGAVDASPAEFRVGGTAATSSDRTPPAWMDDARVYNTVLTADELEAVRQEVAGPPAEPKILSFGAGEQSGYVTGGSNLVLSASATGQAPLTFRWLRNGGDLPGGIVTTNASIVALSYGLGTAVPELAGTYTLILTNSVGSTTSAPVAFDVTTIFNTKVVSNIWTLLAGSVTYLGTGISERSLAYSPVSANYPGGSLIVPHYAALGNRSIQVINPADGSTGPQLAMSDYATFEMTNGVRGLNMAGAGDDGAIYIGSLTTSATNMPYYLYRYSSDDSATVLPTIAYTGDPGGASYPGLRWGDSMTVRGKGATTEILIAPAGGAAMGSANYPWETNVVALLRTADGTNFTPTVIWVTNAPAGFAALGLAFGPGTNTFYAKNSGYYLRLVEFDVNTGLGWVRQTYDLNAVPLCVTGIGTDATGTQLGAVAVETPDNFRLYRVADPTKDPEMLDQEPFTSDNPNTTGGGMGAVAFGTNGTIYVLDSANGIKAFQLDTNYTQPASFSITGIAARSQRRGRVVACRKRPHLPGPIARCPRPRCLVAGWPAHPGQRLHRHRDQSLSGCAGRQSVLSCRRPVTAICKAYAETPLPPRACLHPD